MTRYRKKPIEVEAWQVGSDEQMPEWADHLKIQLEYWKGAWLINENNCLYIFPEFPFREGFEVIE